MKRILATTILILITGSLLGLLTSPAKDPIWMQMGEGIIGVLVTVIMIKLIFWSTNNLTKR